MKIKELKYRLQIRKTLSECNDIEIIILKNELKKECERRKIKI